MQKSHDDDGTRKVMVPIRYDGRVLAIHGSEADRATKTIINRFNATILYQVFGQLHEIEGKEATYIPPDHPTAPIKGGWLVRGATVNPPIDPELLEPGASIVTKVNDTAGFPPPYEKAVVPGEVYFLKSGLSFKAMTRKANWYQDASMAELLDGLSDPASEGTERADITMSIHVRLLAADPGHHLDVHDPPPGAGRLRPQHVHQPGLRPGQLGHVLRRRDALPVPRLQRRPRPLPRRLAPPLRLRPPGHDPLGLDQDVKRGGDSAHGRDRKGA